MGNIDLLRNLGKQSWRVVPIMLLLASTLPIGENALGDDPRSNSIVLQIGDCQLQLTASEITVLPDGEGTSVTLSDELSRSKISLRRYSPSFLLAPGFHSIAQDALGGIIAHRIEVDKLMTVGDKYDLKLTYMHDKEHEMTVVGDLEPKLWLPDQRVNWNAVNCSD